MTASANDRRWTTAAALGFAVVLLGFEALCLLLLCGGWWRLPLLLHVAASLLANTVAWRRGTAPNAPLATLRMQAMLLPFLGPVASLAATILLLLQTMRPAAAPDAAMWHEHLFPNLAADPINDRMDEIARRQPAPAEGEDVESFYDVLRWGTLSEREHVLSLISRSFRAEFAPVLREALASDDLGLRAQAAAGLSLLETRTSGRLSALQRSLREADSEASREESAIALAQALSGAAHSGLYDELRTSDMRREIVALLTPIFRARSADPAIATMLGRTMIHLGSLDEAVATLTQSIDTSHAVDEETDAAFGWLMEGLFRKGDFTRLATLLGRRRDKSATIVARDSPLAPALAFWGGAT